MKEPFNDKAHAISKKEIAWANFIDAYLLLLETLK